MSIFLGIPGGGPAIVAEMPQKLISGKTAVHQSEFKKSCSAKWSADAESYSISFRSR